MTITLLSYYTNNMSNKIQKIEKLLAVAKSGSGASPQEACTAASIALKLATNSSLGGHVVARCRVAVYKTQRRLG